MAERKEVQEKLGVLIIGLNDAEQKMLSAVVRLSVHRNPALMLLDESAKEQASVILVDGASGAANKWAKENHLLLRKKPVIWVDSNHVKAHHVGLTRPVMWSNLPIVISQAIDSFESMQTDALDVPTTQSVKTNNDDVCVLAVDDSKAVCDYVASALASAGIKAITANSGEQALEIIAERSDFACVLMDVLMPGMDGYDACRAIKNKYKNMPVVMLTGKTSPFDRIRAKMAGCDAYLTKPVNQKDLINKLQTYI